MYHGIILPNVTGREGARGRHGPGISRALLCAIYLVRVSCSEGSGSGRISVRRMWDMSGPVIPGHVSLFSSFSLGYRVHKKNPLKIWPNHK